MRIISEFKKFALRGNVFDVAVGVIIGTAFGKIVASLVEGIIMPTLGLILGGINITDKTLKIGDAVVKWGAFMQSIIDFLIIATTIFLVIKFFNILQKKEAIIEDTTSREALLLMEIRDLLRDKSQA